MKTYDASELFDLQINGSFPLNCQFVPKKPIPSPFDASGIYMLFFDQEIVYIGLADNQPALERIQMQLSTITLRGETICFNPESQVAVTNALMLNTVFNTQILNKNANGPKTSVNRVKFAASKWELFSQLNQDILSRFLIIWFPKNECQDETLLEIRNRWVRELMPICNG
jgi:hypothetical protein